MSAILLLGLNACSTAPPAACGAAGAIPMVEVRLLFGLSRPDGGRVDDAAWRDFVARAITPRFPDGLTILAAEGQWRDRQTGQVTAEPSRVVVIDTQRSPDLAVALVAIRGAYRDAFRQQSVGVVLAPICAAF